MQAMSQSSSKKGKSSAQAAVLPPKESGISEEAAFLLARARNMAFAEAAQGRIGNGLCLLQDALETEPMAHDLLSDMAALLLSAGELTHAEAYARKALDISPEHGASLYTLAFAQSGQQSPELARETLRHLLQGDALRSLMQEAPDLLPVAMTELSRLDGLLG